MLMRVAIKRAAQGVFLYMGPQSPTRLLGKFYFHHYVISLRPYDLYSCFIVL